MHDQQIEAAPADLRQPDRGLAGAAALLSNRAEVPSLEQRVAAEGHDRQGMPAGARLSSFCHAIVRRRGGARVYQGAGSGPTPLC